LGRWRGHFAWGRLVRYRPHGALRLLKIAKAWFELAEEQSGTAAYKSTIKTQ
jgi:hypothetical protein